MLKLMYFSTTLLVISTLTISQPSLLTAFEDLYLSFLYSDLRPTKGKSICYLHPSSDSAGMGRNMPLSLSDTHWALGELCPPTAGELGMAPPTKYESCANWASFGTQVMGDLFIYLFRL